MANEVRIIIEGDDNSRSAFREAERSTERLDQTLQDAADSAAELGDAAEESGNTIGSVLGERASGFLDNLGGAAGGAGEMLGKLGPWGKAAAVAIGVAMLGAAAAVKGLHEAIDASIERSAALGRMKAQLLLSPKDAAQYAKTAAKVYTDNWGETLEQSSEFVRDAALYIMPTVDQMKGQITPSLDVVAEKVAALASTMDEDGKRVSVAIKQMLVTGMAKSADEAFNLLHAGIAKGVNGADDLLDTFIEYSTEFRALGLNGSQAMGLLSQGLKTGARDADTVADGLKEIAIRAKDGSTTSAAAFKMIGLDAQKLSADFAAGGPRASKALDMVLDKLRAIKDPMQQNAVATALFGTKAEDLQKALFGLDLDTAAAELGDIANASDIAAAHLSGNAYSAIEAYQRKWQMFKADMGDKFLPVFEQVMGKIQEFADKVAPTVHLMLDMIAKKWEENRAGIEQFGRLMEVVLGGAGQAVLGAFFLAIMAVVTAIGYIGTAWVGVKQVAADVIHFFLDALGTIVHGAAAAFGWIPGLGPKLKAAADDFDGFAGRVNRALAGINDKTVHVNVVTNAPQALGQTGKASSWKIAASGGLRTGMTVVGEHGAEIVDLGAGGRVINNNTARRMVAGQNGASGASAAPAILILSDGRAGGAADFVLGLLQSGALTFRDGGGNLVTAS